MTSDDAAARLVRLLEGADIDLDRPTASDLTRAWDAVRIFAAEPVDDVSEADDSDGLLAQYGTYDWGDGEHFEVDLTRQFAFDDEHGEYSHMSQLRCTFLFQPTDELRALGSANLWSFGLSQDEFFRQALALPGFRKVVEAEQVPLSLVVDYNEV